MSHVLRDLEAARRERDEPTVTARARTVDTPKHVAYATDDHRDLDAPYARLRERGRPR
jgi:hypothetical protein